MNQEPGTLGLFGLVLGGNVYLALETELGDSVRDGVVQAPIQGSEFIDGERHIPFERQVGDGLAEIPVVVDDLIHGVPHLEEFLPVGGGCHPHLGQGERVAARRPRDPKALGIVIGFLRPQRSRELLQEQGNALGELLGGGGALGALLDLPPTSRDELVSVAGEKFVHGRLSMNNSPVSWQRWLIRS